MYTRDHLSDTNEERNLAGMTMNTSTGETAHPPLFSAEVGQDAQLDTSVITLVYAPAAPEDRLEVAIAPHYGSNMFRLKAGSHDVIFCDPALLSRRLWTGAFVLWPLPNRVRDKKFEFQGREYSLAAVHRKQGNEVLIHGLVDDQPWSFEQPVAERDSASATTHIAIVPGTSMYELFPFKSSLTLRYTVMERAIRVGYTVVNNDTRDMPYGFALHPYFATLSGSDHTYITLPARSMMESDKQLLPTGRLIDVRDSTNDLRLPTPVSKIHLDAVFTDLEHGQPGVVDSRTHGIRVDLRASDDFTHMVLYTLEQGFVCFENQTGSTDMINLYTRAKKEHDEDLLRAAHLLILPPGQTHAGYIEYGVEHYAPPAS